jgi:hypothetical protein
MTPVDLAERISALERNQATLMAQMEEARRQVTLLGVLPIQFAELAVSVLNLKEDIAQIIKAQADAADAETVRIREEKTERRSVRGALYVLAGTIAASLITAVGLIIVAKIGAA